MPPSIFKLLKPSLHVLTELSCRLSDIGLNAYEFQILTNIIMLILVDKEHHNLSIIDQPCSLVHAKYSLR